MVFRENNPAECCRILKNLAETCRILQNLAESGRFLYNCKILITISQCDMPMLITGLLASTLSSVFFMGFIYHCTFKVSVQFLKIEVDDYNATK